MGAAANADQSAQLTPQQTALYQLCLKQVCDGGPALMSALIADARNALVSRNAALVARTDPLLEAMTALEQHEQALRASLRLQLQRVFEQRGPEVAVAAAPAPELRANQMTLMDDVQVQEGLELARAQQATLAEVDLPLTELNALISTVQGWKTVQPERNPLRPAAFILALKQAYRHMPVSQSQRVHWLELTTPPLGHHLLAIYARVLTLLKAADTRPAAFSVTAAPPTQAPRGRMRRPRRNRSRASSAMQNEELLLLEELWRLIMDEAATDLPASAAAPAAAEPAASASDGEADDEIEPTWPAALEALQEMQLVDVAMQRLRARSGPNRQSGAVVANATQLAQLDGSDLYQTLCGMAHGAGQLLGLEAVRLMVEQKLDDDRLQPAVRQAIMALESPLLRLAMVDPRLFSDKQHPARVLLDAIVEQALRYERPDAAGYPMFAQQLGLVIDELKVVPIDNADPFALCLATLRQQWEAQLQKEYEQREHALSGQRREEELKRLSALIAQDIRRRDDSAEVPEDLMQFACGPWAQVIAQGQLTQPDGDDQSPMALRASSGRDDMALVHDLFWSVNPERVGTDSRRLIKMIPGLLARIRAGLRSIHYPEATINAFLDRLMPLHQEAIARASAQAQVQQAREKAAAPAPGPASSRLEDSGHASLLDNLDFDDSIQSFSASIQHEHSGLTPLPPLVTQLPPGSDAFSIELGSWVEVDSDGFRLQAWLQAVSPNGEMFMFKTPTGRNQTMTRQKVDQAIRDGRLKVAPPDA